MKLVLENKEGKAIRLIQVSGDSAVVVSRKDTRRVEVLSSVAGLEAKKVKFELLGQVTRQTLEQAPLQVAGGRLKIAPAVIQEVVRNQKSEKEDDKRWWSSLAILSVLQVLFMVFILTRSTESAKIDEEVKQQIVQIVKRIPVKPQPKVIEAPQEQKQVAQHNTSKVKPTKTASIKRMGALSVFGSLSQGKQRGGVNLGAVNTSDGPGLGGTAGSGGVQTTLYGKGLVAAPLGAGSNMQGGGGYGTKGKGGGQAGYGKMSLIGSAGSSTIPLGREALIEGGLDRDLIADVIYRNMGQFRFCYEQGLQGEPALAGRVAIRFTIGGNGTVRTAGV